MSIFLEDDMLDLNLQRLERGWGLPDKAAPARPTPDIVFVRADRFERFSYAGRVVTLRPPGTDLVRTVAHGLGLA